MTQVKRAHGSFFAPADAAVDLAADGWMDGLIHSSLRAFCLADAEVTTSGGRTHRLQRRIATCSQKRRAVLSVGPCREPRSEYVDGSEPSCHMAWSFGWQSDQ